MRESPPDDHHADDHDDVQSDEDERPRYDSNEEDEDEEHADNDQEHANSDEDDDDDDDEEPRLKYTRLTKSLAGVYRNGDAVSSSVVFGDRMVRFYFIAAFLVDIRWRSRRLMSMCCCCR